MPDTMFLNTCHHLYSYCIPMSSVLIDPPIPFHIGMLDMISRNVSLSTLMASLLGHSLYHWRSLVALMVWLERYRGGSGVAAAEEDEEEGEEEDSDNQRTNEHMHECPGRRAGGTR